MLKWFFALVFALLFFITPVFADIVCTPRSSDCSNFGEAELFKMSNTVNAHAELTTESTYTDRICCMDTDDIMNPNDFSCTGLENSGHFVTIYGSTNSHVQFPAMTYANPVCFNSRFSGSGFNCAYYDFDPGEGSCIYSLSAQDNAHVAGCGVDGGFGNFVYCFTCFNSGDVLKVDVFTRNNGKRTGIFHPGDTVEIVFTIRNFSCSNLQPSTTSLVVTKDGEVPFATANLSQSPFATIDAGIIGVQSKFMEVDRDLSGFGPYKIAVSATAVGETLVGNNSKELFFSVVTPDRPDFAIDETSQLFLPLIVIVVLSIILSSARRHRKRTLK